MTSPAKLRAMYESNMSIRSIGIAAGMSKQAVRTRLVLSGVKIRTVSEGKRAQYSAQYSRLDKIAVSRQYAEGDTIKILAAKFKVPVWYMKRFMARNWIQRRRRAFSAYNDNAYGPVQVNEKEFVYDYTVELLSQQALARRHGICRRTAKQILIRLGIPLRSRSVSNAHRLKKRGRR